MRVRAAESESRGGKAPRKQNSYELGGKVPDKVSKLGREGPKQS